jgi:hypothetical protein
MEFVGFRQIEDAVVPLIPAFQAAADVVLGGSGLEAHERVRKVVVLEVILRREVIGFRLAPAADLLRKLVGLVHVVRDGAEVVEELAEEVPAAVFRHHGRAEKLITGGCNRLAELRALSMEIDVAEAFILRCAGAIIGPGSGREPAFVDASTVRAEGIEVARVEFQSTSGHQERTRHPTRGEP